MPRLPISLALLAMLIVPTGCGGEGDSATAEAELDRLRALPYVDASAAGPERARSGVVIHDRLRAWPGYTLYTVQMLARAELIDEAGATVRSWQADSPGRWERAELLPGGDLVVIGADAGDGPAGEIPDESRYLCRFGTDGRLLWKRRMNAHHDVEPAPGDRLLALSFQRRRLPAVDLRHEVRDDLLALLDAGGRLLEIRSLFDAFWQSPEIHRLRPVRPDRRGGRPWIDLFHANSVQWIRRPDLEGSHPIFASGNVLISSRHQNCIAVLNWNDGRLVWAWGADQLLGPHDAQVLENGNILVFDNGMGRGWSRVLEIDPLGGRIVWEYRAPDPTSFYTLSKGSSQRLPNGNTLVANSDSGEAFEITAEGEVVWLFRTPHTDGRGNRAAIVRVIRHDREFVAPLLEAASR